MEIRNRQRARRVDVGRLRGFAEALLTREFGLRAGALGIHLIGARAMAAMNWRWLGHEGSTDILTFDHRARGDEAMHGELFISLDDAVAQAEVFRTSPGAELIRYVIHGVLHLLGHDDQEPGARRAMKRVENRLVRRMTSGGGVSGLIGASGARPAGRVRRGTRVPGAEASGVAPQVRRRS